MRALNKCEVTTVTGASYFGAMGSSIMDGMSDSDKAFAVTGLGVGFIVGSYIGSWAMWAGIAAVGGYVGYDWFLKGETAPASA